MKNSEVVEAFFNRETGQSENRISSGDKLFSYNTCIAQWVGSKLLINTTKYSRTTSKLQGEISRKAGCQVGYLINVPRNTKDLNELYNEKV